MKVEAEKKTRTQDCERTINGQDFVVAKPTAVVNGSSIDVDFIKKGFCPTSILAPRYIPTFRSE